MAEGLLDLGAYELSIGDTIGIANPLQCYELCSYLLKRIPANKIALHMHDTRGMALANIYQALRLGIATFDSSAGGLGGCPLCAGGRRQCRFRGFGEYALKHWIKDGH